MAFVKPKLLIPKRELFLPPERRRLPRPAPYIFVPRRFAPTMLVAFDAKASAFPTDTNSGSLTNNNLTIGVLGTILFGVFASAVGGAFTVSVPSAMTWAGVSMTLIGHATSTNGVSNVYVYALVSPATGNHPCIVTYTPGTAGVTNDLDCYSFSGTDISSLANAVPLANVVTDASASSTTHYPSSPFSVTTANGEMASAVMNNGTSGGTGAMAIGTVINGENSGNNNYVSGYNPAVGSSTQLQFNIGGATPVCGVAFRIRSPVVSLSQKQLVMM